MCLKTIVPGPHHKTLRRILFVVLNFLFLFLFLQFLSQCNFNEFTGEIFTTMIDNQCAISPKKEIGSKSKKEDCLFMINTVILYELSKLFARSFNRARNSVGSRRF